MSEIAHRLIRNCKDAAIEHAANRKKPLLHNSSISTFYREEALVESAAHNFAIA